MDTRIVKNLFKEKFGTEGMLYFSPGRINLIDAGHFPTEDVFFQVPSIKAS